MAAINSAVESDRSILRGILLSAVLVMIDCSEGKQCCLFGRFSRVGDEIALQEISS